MKKSKYRWAGLLLRRKDDRWSLSQNGSRETIRDHWDDHQRDGQTHSRDLSESGGCLTGCKQIEIERSGRVVVLAEKTSSRQKDHQSIKVSK
ncbi:unnamed protein product [Heligmosomoides polygyrus]|uniref:HTH myb-type domain-containing protein n=1 Tax=Heligmosomoides polygyrus TaxID=6339 RepID=A0A183FHV8_HELPZ|nr:unnamed protein product [Heligmosomoides polygyrus]